MTVIQIIGCAVALIGIGGIYLELNPGKEKSGNEMDRDVVDFYINKRKERERLEQQGFEKKFLDDWEF